MKAISNKIFIRNLESEKLVENFLISTVLSILVIRFYLQITGFPQIGGGGFHIAHMLWGGLLMVISILMFTSLLSRHAFKIAVILGGVGFGAFIDELGKFITSDNNYFFQPTIALIYILLILLYFVSKSIPKLKPVSRQEYLLNALELIKDAIVDDLDLEEKEKAISYLKKTNPNDLITKYLNEMLSKFESLKVKGISRIGKFWDKLKNTYIGLAKKSWFVIALYILFIGSAINSLSNFVEFMGPFLSLGIITLAFPELMELLFSTLSAIIIVIGMIRLHFARLWAYQMLKTSLLVSIFLTQIFDFYRIELLGFFDLFLDLFVLGVVTYMIDREKQIKLSLNTKI